MQRRLAAILAADVVNYTRHIERDETGTLAALREARKQDLEPVVAKHEGRVFKLMGDGFLVEFSSVINAVSAAIELQERTAARAAGRPSDERIELRVGVNIGDIVVDEGDAYGEGVNVAVRLQEQASAGGICVSRAVRDQVRDRLRLDLVDRGAVALKNASRAQHVYEILGKTNNGGGAGAAAQNRQGRPATPQSLLADRMFGGYSRAMYSYYEGEYVCSRPSLSRPGHYVIYPLTIGWEDHRGLTFVDRNAGFEQHGVIAIPTGAAFIHLLTLDGGSARLITAEHMPETHTRMVGMVLTLANPGGRELRPAASPILIERRDRDALPYAALSGLFARDDPRLAALPYELLVGGGLRPMIMKHRTLSR